MAIKGLDQLKFVVVGADDVAVSAHQHPDAAQRFIFASPRIDLRWVDLDAE